MGGGTLRRSGKATISPSRIKPRAISATLARPEATTGRLWAFALTGLSGSTCTHPFHRNLRNPEAELPVEREQPRPLRPENPGHVWVLTQGSSHQRRPNATQ